MKITKSQLRKIIKEESHRLLKESVDPGPEALEILDEMVTWLEERMYKYDPRQEALDDFAVKAMEIIGGVEPLIVALIEESEGTKY